MKQIEKTIPVPNDPFLLRYFFENAAFFDIETTGFSAKTAFVYLIGMAIRKKDSIHIIQFLAEKRVEEAEVINRFYQKICHASAIITFNGNGFDIPFLKTREAIHHLKLNWEGFSYLDLYKTAGKLSHLLKLPNKKQKTIEQFLGIDRQDLFTGGDLIPVFYQYEKQQDAESETLLLLHNYEDVLGMAKLLPLLSYQEFFESPVSVSEASLTQETDKASLFLTLPSIVPFPKQTLCQSTLSDIKFRQKDVCLHVKALKGALRHYFEPYQDYYYLPNEDRAVHKSVAAFVDSSHKKKATASTCYAKQDGTFLPQENALFTPCFYPEKKTKRSYFAFQGDFLSDKEKLAMYARHLLNAFYAYP